MAMNKAESLSPKSAHITQGFTGADKRPTGETVLEKSGSVQLKVNRLKRTKGSRRSSGSQGCGNSSVITKKTDTYSSSDVICISCEEAGSESAINDVKRSSSRSTKNMSSLTKDCLSSSPKLDTLPLRRPLKQSTLKMNTRTLRSPHLQLSVHESTNGSQCLPIGDSVASDIIDLCGDESLSECGSEQVNVITRVNEQGGQGRSDPPKAAMTGNIRTIRISPTTSGNHTERTGRRAIFSEQIREELLGQIQAQNRFFPARRVYSLLLNRQNGFETEGITNHALDSSTLGHSAPGKRKQEVQSHSDGGPPKRRQLDHDAVDASGNPSSPRKSRLSMSWRKKQPAVSSDASETPPLPVSERQEDEGLWTEKYQPCHSSEVMGNSASVRKLHGWLKEWRIRADVEERRKRQEDRRMKAESSESWDCGDFEGERKCAVSSGPLRSAALIQGPIGVGKTAAVYACARELGFKVFEVNSSSLRSGRLILSQLSEATQSHQVGAQQNANLPPPIRTSHAPGTDKPPATSLSGQEPSEKVMAASSKPHVRSRMVSRKRRAVALHGTLTRFFKITGTSVKKSTDHPQNAQGPDAVEPDLLPPSPAEDTSVTELELLSEDTVVDRKNTRLPLSLILFEEVDVIFDVDIGFLTAIKTLMITTKRPVILTTSDPLFSQTFHGRLEEIHFESPHMRTCGQTHRASTSCWLRIEATSGGVSWSWSSGHAVEEAALPSSSTRGRCRTWSELQSRGCLEVLVDGWRTGRSLFRSHLAVLLAQLPKASRYADRSTAKTVGPTLPKTLGKGAVTPNLANTEQRPRKLSRLKLKKHKSAGADHEITHNPCSECPALSTDRLNQLPPPNEQTNQSSGETADVSIEERLSKLVSCSMDSLARFLEAVSFLDVCLHRQVSRAEGCTMPASPGRMGANMADGVLDEPREEVVSPLDLESSYELLAMVEGLGFLQCRAEVFKTRRALKLIEGRGREPWQTPPSASPSALRTPGQSDEGFCLPEPCEPSLVLKSQDVLSKVLSSKAFCCHGNKKAVVLDYLPALRSICRLERVKQQSKRRSSRYLKDIRLALSRSTVQLLASDVSPQPRGDVLAGDVMASC
ncbi:ATPase family AAA domain-containing protein 5b isoform X2 [Brachyhypopomus gauderio]|uniref:ATPase family AAA domain-containing protein 5b isoform X2 n=1 Tax=Brachyhypopomus gauderio TaxID=698409 RepID=UPI0040411CD8